MKEPSFSLPGHIDGPNATFPVTVCPSGSVYLSAPTEWNMSHRSILDLYHQWCVAIILEKSASPLTTQGLGFPICQAYYTYGIRVCLLCWFCIATPCASESHQLGWASVSSKWKARSFYNRSGGACLTNWQQYCTSVAQEIQSQLSPSMPSYQEGSVAEVTCLSCFLGSVPVQMECIC